MSFIDPSPSPLASRVLSIFRIVAGLMFLSSGMTIVFGFPPPPAGMPMPPFNPTSQLGIGGILEIVGGVAITLGLFTRCVAFVLSGMMAIAYFQFHIPQSIYPTANAGVPAIMYCFFFLYLVFAGPGVWSVDAAIARSKSDGAGTKLP